VYGYPLVLSERVVEGIVLKGERLVERLDLVYNVEGADEDAVGALVPEFGRRSCATEVTVTRDARFLHDDDIVENISALVSFVCLFLRHDNVRTRK
jgi:hypothetical protein